MDLFILGNISYCLYVMGHDVIFNVNVHSVV